MNIKITKKQNVKIDGVKFVAVPNRDCTGCAFRTSGYADACIEVNCGAGDRTDKTSVIFVRKEKAAP